MLFLVFLNSRYEKSPLISQRAFQWWWRDRDLNPRTAINGCRFSRPVLSTTQPSLQQIVINRLVHCRCCYMYTQVTKLKPGDVLLSHGEAPHYHRRYCVSLLSSAWNQVGPQCYGRQANFKIRKAVKFSSNSFKRLVFL